jgi:hypothetical protein
MPCFHSHLRSRVSVGMLPPNVRHHPRPICARPAGWLTMLWNTERFFNAQRKGVGCMRCWAYTLLFSLGTVCLYGKRQWNFAAQFRLEIRKDIPIGFHMFAQVIHY